MSSFSQAGVRCDSQKSEAKLLRALLERKETYFQREGVWHTEMCPALTPPPGQRLGSEAHKTRKSSASEWERAAVPGLPTMPAILTSLPGPWSFPQLCRICRALHICSSWRVEQPALTIKLF